MNKVFITGAAGFVGSRLVEVLKEKYNCDVNVLLRNISRAARISRYQLNYFQGTITDEAILEQGIMGCDAVVHCAHDFSSDEINLKAADIISKLCLKHKVKSLVYISTSAVHLSGAEKTISEKSAFNFSWDYAANKLAVEKKLTDYFSAEKLPVIILRPSVIYGPFAGVWTNGIVKDMMESRIILPFNGDRICNAVYIDDVVQAIIKAIEIPQEKTGQAYLVSGAEKITWKQFLGGYKNYPGVQDLVLWDDEQSSNWFAKLKDAPATEVKPTLVKDPITYLKSKFFYKVYQRLLKSSFLKEKLLSAKAKIPRPLKYPSAESLETFGSAAQIDISKIQNEIGYKPEFDFETGMKKTLIYLDWYNLNAN